jgi:hypothetical protein
LWARQTAILVGIYLAVMIALTLWMPVWFDVDARFFSRVDALVPPRLSPQVALVDVRDWGPTKIVVDRETIAQFLQGFVTHPQQRPQAIVIDIEFDPCQLTPCPQPMETARSQLIRSLDAAAAHNIKVYLAEGVETDLNDHVVSLDTPDPEIYAHFDVKRPDRHEAEIYSHFTDAAQTHVAPLANGLGYFYRRCYPVRLMNGYSLELWSMVTRVQMAGAEAADTACDTEHTALRYGASIAPLGPDGYAIISPPTGYSITASSPFPADADFDGRYVIVGTVRCDRIGLVNCDRPPPGTSGWSGPELLAWALSDDLESGESSSNRYGYYKTRPNNAALLLLVPAFSALVALAFTAWFFLLRRLELREMRRFLPWVAAALSLVVGLAVFAGFEAWMMLSQTSIQPQVTLISLGMVLSATLCGVRGNQIEFQQLYSLEPRAAEGYDYDVFISYAHDEGAWVYEHVYAPFREAKLPNGQKLSIFFDTTEIRGGTDWQTKISLAIDASRFIVPVYSESYFRKPYCRYEISRAHRGWIHAGAESRRVLPVMRGHPKILESVDDIQAVSIDDQPDIVEQYVSEIIARLYQTGPSEIRT